MEIRYVFMLIVILIIFDATAVNVSFISAYSNTTIGREAFFSNKYFILLIFTWLATSYFTQLYHLYTIQTFKNILSKSILTFILYSFLTVIVFFLFNSKFHQAVVYCIFVQLLLVLCSRTVIYLFNNYHQHATRYRRRVIIIGCDDTGKKLHHYFLRNSMSFTFAGFFDNITPYGPGLPEDIKGGLNNVIDYASRHQIKEIYTTKYPEHGNQYADLFALAEFNCLKVRYVADMNETINPGYCLRYLFENIRILSKRTEPLDRLRNRIIKRSFDIFFSSMIIIFILSWLIPIISLLIRLESSGPTFFLQLRSGRDNKPFWCYKFRSMRINEESGYKQASKGDARITKIGAFIRKTSIDELPQFFNVLLGNMTVVGPRPHMLQHTEQYKQIVDNYMVRHFIKPGITGWAQVNGFRGETKNVIQMQARVQHDIWYGVNWSLYLDLKVIFATIINAVKGEINAF